MHWVLIGSEIERLSVCVAIKFVFFPGFMIKKFLMFLQKYLKSTFSTEQVSHTETTNSDV